LKHQETAREREGDNKNTAKLIYDNPFTAAKTINKKLHSEVS
jgi:hypothetical protein